MTDHIYLENLEYLKGKTIGVVYIFENESAAGFEHYHIWKSDIISCWLKAIQEINCIPYIMDVRTFVQKAINETLPSLDFVLNLNCGSCQLSPMSLVPATCAFIGIPCIPCDAVSIVVGENKKTSNLLAYACKLKVPTTFLKSQENSIYRPLNYGSSYGVRTGYYTPPDSNGFFQEFIKGYDLTTPIVYSPLKEDFDFLPSILYLPDDNDSNWYFGEKEKIKLQGYTEKIIDQLSSDLRQKYIDVCNTTGISTYCRIDARICATNIETLKNILNKGIDINDIYFIEINPMPTIRDNNAFGNGFKNILNDSSLCNCLKLQKSIFNNITVHSFLLINSILKHYNHVQK